MGRLIDDNHWYWRQIERDWAVVREQWNDGARLQFATRFWDPLERGMNDYLRALDELTLLLEAAQAVAQER